MPETSCPACGASVDLARDVATGEVVPLEKYTDSSSDAARYRVVELGPPLKVQRVPPEAVGDFFPDHRFDCKDFGAGRTF